MNRWRFSARNGKKKGTNKNRSIFKNNIGNEKFTGSLNIGEARREMTSARNHYLLIRMNITRNGK